MGSGASALIVGVPGDAAADRGEHVVGELDRVEMFSVDPALGAARNAPRTGTPPWGRSPRPRPGVATSWDWSSITPSPAAEFPTVDDADDLAAGQISEGRDPRFDPLPGAGFVSASIRRRCRAGLMANAPVTSKDGTA